jgi:hypothetical protein
MITESLGSRRFFSDESARRLIVERELIMCRLELLLEPLEEALKLTSSEPRPSWRRLDTSAHAMQLAERALKRRDHPP